jgi:hypothetical protein
MMNRSIAVLVFQLFVVLLLGTFTNVGSAANATQVMQSSVSNLVPAASATPDASNYCLQLTNSARYYYYYASSQCSSNYRGGNYPSYYNYNNPYYYSSYYPYSYTRYPYRYGYYQYNYPYDYGYYRYYYPGYYYYNGNYYPGTYSPTPTTFELTVETNPTGIAAVSGGGTYDQGTVASFSIGSPIVSKQAGERYVFSSWSGDFSGTSPSGTVTLDSAKAVIANYELQYYLDVSATPQGIVPVTGAGWYAADASATVGSVPPIVSGPQGTEYVFQSWTVDGVPASGNTLSVTMDNPHSVVAQYKTQYVLTVSSQYGTPQGAGWYDAGSSATFSVAPRVDTSYGVSQVFDGWTGDFQSTEPTGTIKMDSPSTVVAVWRTDSTVLYATIAAAIGGAFVLGIGLAAIAVSRSRRNKTTSAATASSRVVNETK